MSQPRLPQEATAPAPACAGSSASLAERRRLAAERQDELADILAGAVFDLFLRRLQERHGGPETGSRP